MLWATDESDYNDTESGKVVAEELEQYTRCIGKRNSALPFAGSQNTSS